MFCIKAKGGGGGEDLKRMHGPSAEGKERTRQKDQQDQVEEQERRWGRSQMAVLRFQTMEGTSDITGLLSGPRVTATEKRGKKIKIKYKSAEDVFVQFR